MSKLTPLEGRLFGRLRVLSHAHAKAYARSRRTEHYWLCRCACGSRRVIAGASLASGNTRSCGCLQREVVQRRNFKHGLAGTAQYRLWRGMITRCYNSARKEYSNYGGRGIAVCKRWRLSFTAFLSDMGKRPPKATLERKNNAGSYTPANCCWATSVAQNRNRRNNRLLSFGGKTRCVAEWAEVTGLRRKTIDYRLRAGWPVKKVLAVESARG